MKKIVVLPGGYHPYHAGHYSLYKAAEEKFPDADIYLAATNDTKSRPFPFEIKKKLAQLAGVNPDQFVQVKSPFKAEEITQKYNPEQDVLIFVRSEKDRNEQPKPGGTKKDGSPSYFQSYDPKSLESFNKHAYIDYLPTIEFGPGIKSATEIRNAWPRLNDKQKLAMVMSLYPATQQNKKLATVAVKMLDAGIIGDAVQGVAEGGAETSWSDDKDIITLQDMLELTKHIKQINLPINDNLKSKLIHWDGNPEEIERINQVTVSKQFPILVMLDGKGQIDWILDGNHRLHKAIQSQAETIPAKLIKPSDLSDKAKKIFHIKEQEVEEAYSDPLTELFDTKGGVRWRGSNRSYVYGNFTSSNGIKYRIQLSSPMYGPSELDPSSFFKDIDTSTALKAKYLEFDQIDETNTRKSGIEGTGAAAEVFGIVVNAILKYIKNNETSMIYFQAKETNRVRLYRSIIKMLLSRLPGWATKEVSGKKKSMLGNFAIYNTNLISDKPSVKEATLINDPEQGYLIVPDGGMGTWDEKSLLSNLIRKFSSMAEMIKEKRYSSLYHSLYEAGVVENMLKALIQYENFKEKQGNRPIAKGKEIDISESTDYISEK